MNLSQAEATLTKNNIAYDKRFGFSSFHYTALVFANERLAWKAYDLLAINGTGILKEGNGQYSIHFYS
jgi:hypothetical protein